MNYSEIYKKLYSNTIEQLKMISDPYNKCEIMTRMMDSLSRLMTADAVEVEDVVHAPTATKKKTKKEPAPPAEDNSVEPTVVDTPVTEEVSDSTTTTDSTTEADQTDNTDDTDIIDRTSDSDPDEWTDELKEKYADAIDYIKNMYNTYEESELNGFVEDNSNHLYKSFDEMPPSAFIAMYTLLKQYVEQQ